MTALPRLGARARRALEAAGITSLDDCVREGRRAVAALDGLDDASLAALDEAVLRAGAAGRDRDEDVLLAG